MESQSAYSQDLEGLLKLDHELPVILLEVVTEVVLAGVDGGAVYLAHEEVLRTFFQSQLRLLI